MKVFALLATKNKGFVIGKIHLDDKKLIFVPWFNKRKNKIEIEYRQISKIEKEFIHITKLLRVILKNNNSIAFSVFDRNKVKQFLEEKINK